LNSQKFGNWLQIAANTGIIAGLILVGLQMQQNSRLLQMQLLKDEATSYLDSEMAIIGDQYADVYQKSIEDPRNMTLSDMRIEESMLWGHSLFRWTNTYRLSELGLYEETQWKSEVNRDAPFFFGSPYGRAWWDTVYQNQLKRIQNSDTESFVPLELLEYVQEAVQTIPINNTEEFFNDVKRNLEKYLDN